MKIVKVRTDIYVARLQHNNDADANPPALPKRAVLKIYYDKVRATAYKDFDGLKTFREIGQRGGAERLSDTITEVTTGVSIGHVKDGEDVLCGETKAIKKNIKRVRSEIGLTPRYKFEGDEFDYE